MQAKTEERYILQDILWWDENRVEVFTNSGRLLEGRISSLVVAVWPGHWKAATPEGRRQPTAETGDSLDCSPGRVAANPWTDAAQGRPSNPLPYEIYSDRIMSRGVSQS